jgi:hypothetical protein
VSEMGVSHQLTISKERILPGRATGIRTPDLLHAIHARAVGSRGPRIAWREVGLRRWSPGAARHCLAHVHVGSHPGSRRGTLAAATGVELAGALVSRVIQLNS